MHKVHLMNHFPLEYTLNYFQLASNNAVFKQTCQHMWQCSACRLCVHFLKADLTSSSLLWKSLLIKNRSLQTELLFFSKTDFRLLPSRPPGRLQAGSSREVLTTGGAIPTGDAPAQEEPPQIPVRPSNDSGASCAPACPQVFENAI